MSRMATSKDSSGGSDPEAVDELITDIEAEMRLHQVRVQEFLDGTSEFEAVVETKERARLLRVLTLLESTLSDLADIAARG